MRIVAVLGGNALLERGEPPETGLQEAHIIAAVRALAPLAAAHDLVITHGNGPQVGMLALESAHDPGPSWSAQAAATYLSSSGTAGPAASKRWWTRT